MSKFLYLFCFFWLPGWVFSHGLEGQWTLQKSTISYKVTHPLHTALGKSLSAKGKGVCYGDGHCEFLVAVPVKTFDSGDNNRDLHMLEVTKAALFPMVTVTVDWKDRGTGFPRSLVADVNVSFAGKTVEYPKLPLDLLEMKEGKAHVAGLLPLSLKDFGIKAPALLDMPIQDSVPVNLDTWWVRSGSTGRTRKD